MGTKNENKVREDLKLRVLQAKAKIPNRTIQPLFLHFFPKFDNKDDRTRLNNVLNCRTTDERITKKLESIADKIKAL